MDTLPPGERYERLIRLVSLARSLEAQGYPNAAKLYWALAHSQQLRESRQAAPSELDNKMAAAIDCLKAENADERLIEALKHGRQALAENRPIRHTEIPNVRVCRACGEVFLGDPPPRCPECAARPITFLEFLPMYHWETLLPSQALVALASAPDEVRAAVQGMSEEQMLQKPAPDAASVHSLVFHIAFDQELLAVRIEKMLTQPYPQLEGVAVWADAEDQKTPVQQLLERYQRSREETVRRLMHIGYEEWQRSGWHNEFGRVTILQQVCYFARHEREHLPQIEEARRLVGG